MSIKTVYVLAAVLSVSMRAPADDFELMRKKERAWRILNGVTDSGKATYQHGAITAVEYPHIDSTVAIAEIAAITVEQIAQAKAIQQQARIPALASIPVSATATLKDQVDALETIIDWYIAQGVPIIRETPVNVGEVTGMVNAWLDTIRETDVPLWMQGTQKSLALLTMYSGVSGVLKEAGVGAADISFTINAIWQYTP